MFAFKRDKAVVAPMSRININNDEPVGGHTEIGVGRRGKPVLDDCLVGRRGKHTVGRETAVRMLRW